MSKDGGTMEHRQRQAEEDHPTQTENVRDYHCRRRPPRRFQGIALPHRRPIAQITTATRFPIEEAQGEATETQCFPSLWISRNPPKTPFPLLLQWKAPIQKAALSVLRLRLPVNDRKDAAVAVGIEIGETRRCPPLPASPIFPPFPPRLGLTNPPFSEEHTTNLNRPLESHQKDSIPNNLPRSLRIRIYFMLLLILQPIKLQANISSSQTRKSTLNLEKKDGANSHQPQHHWKLIPTITMQTKPSLLHPLLLHQLRDGELTKLPKITLLLLAK